MNGLSGKTALVVGVANEHSIAWGCAKALHDAGAQVAITYLNAKAEPYVRPLAESIESPIIMPLDVNDDFQLEAVFGEIEQRWGQLDTLVHSIAFAPRDDLQGRVVDTSREGFRAAMDVSVHSFIRMVRMSEPLMTNGGSCMTMSFYGASKVVGTYNVMGPVKAALEAVTRELASELGEKGIRVNTLSPGPMATRAASGIKDFDEMMDAAAKRAPTHQLVSIEDCGAYAAFLASDASRNITGGLHFIDGGYNIMG
jgi:enoyl-[acyl-carrier protein] reductase I